jgi:MarR family transcriptional regulator, organic hydroperoxide resistance regulator
MDHEGVRDHEQHLVEAFEQALVRISWLGQRQFAQLLDDERFKLTMPQFVTLLHLHYCSGECAMSALAEATHQSAASLTGVVDRLLEKDLVRRERHEDDRRKVMVTVTGEGEALLVAIKQARREQMAAALAELEASEVVGLMELLDKVMVGMLRTVEHDAALKS